MHAMIEQFCSWGNDRLLKASTLVKVGLDDKKSNVCMIVKYVKSKMISGMRV